MAALNPGVRLQRDGEGGEGFYLFRGFCRGAALGECLCSCLCLRLCLCLCLCLCLRLCLCLCLCLCWDQQLTSQQLHPLPCSHPFPSPPPATERLESGRGGQAHIAARLDLHGLCAEEGAAFARSVCRFYAGLDGTGPCFGAAGSDSGSGSGSGIDIIRGSSSNTLNKSSSSASARASGSASGRPADAIVVLVVGRGAHSAGRRSVLGPVVERLLRAEGHQQELGVVGLLQADREGEVKVLVRRRGA